MSMPNTDETSRVSSPDGAAATQFTTLRAASRRALEGATVAQLTAVRAAIDDLLATAPSPPPAVSPRLVSATSMSERRPLPMAPTTGKHVAEVLGQRVAARTLGELQAAVVDLVAALDPSVLEGLARMRARKRRFVSRLRDAIHPGRPDLQVVQARSGWWVSANVSYAAACPTLQALCTAASLKFGEDIRFPI
jgi:hypothetical protein